MQTLYRWRNYNKNEEDKSENIRKINTEAYFHNMKSNGRMGCQELIKKPFWMHWGFVSKNKIEKEKKKENQDVIQL